MNLYEESIQLLRQMVRIPSLSGEEAGVAACIGASLDAWGIPYELVRGNVLARNRRFDPGKPTLALDAHLDTVPVSSGYSRDPFDSGNDPDILQMAFCFFFCFDSFDLINEILLCLR